MAELDRLEVVIQADIDQLRRELKKTESATKTSAGKMKRSLQSLGTSIGALGKRMARLGPLAAVAVAGGLFIATKRALAFADAIGKTSDKIGVHTSFLQEMRFAADQSGIATATLDSNLERFVKRIGEAARGTGEAKKIYEDWGIAIRDANGQIRAADVVLDDVADAMVATTSQTERVAAAAALFGREGVVMVNMLRLGARGMRELRKQANDLGLVLDRKMVREAEKLNDQLSQVAQTIKINLTRALIGIAPTIIRVGNAFRDAAPLVREFIESFLPAHLLGPEVLKRQIAALNDEILELVSGPAGDVGTLLQGADAVDDRISALKAQVREMKALLAEAEQTDALIRTQLEAAGLGGGGDVDSKVKDRINELERQAAQAELMVQAQRRGEQAVRDLNVAIQIQEGLIAAKLIPATASLQEATAFAADATNEQANAIGQAITRAVDFSTTLDRVKDSQEKLNDQLSARSDFAETLRAENEELELRLKFGGQETAELRTQLSLLAAKNELGKEAARSFENTIRANERLRTELDKLESSVDSIATPCVSPRPEACHAFGQKINALFA